MIEQELAATLGRGRYKRPGASADEAPAAAGHRHGHRSRRITGSFGTVEIAVPRARMTGMDGATREWRSQALPH